MPRDPFNTDEFLEIDFDTSRDSAESWQDALKNEEGAEQIVDERRGSSARMRFFYVAAAGVLLLLTVRLLFLQVLNSEHNKALAEGNRIRETDIRAPRGVIYDAKRQLVARNTPNFEVTIVPSELPRKAEDRRTVYTQLAGLLKKQPAEIQQAAEAKGLRYGQGILVADKLDRDSSVLVIMRGVDLPGVHTEDNPQRQYDQPQLYAHLLGYTGRVSADDLKQNPDFQSSDYVGKSGLEAVYERDLRGQDGKRRSEVNAQGQSVKELQSSDPTSGKNLVLTIDQDLQNAISVAVDKGIRTGKKPAGGSAIALNPKNGEVLGMVSLPSFDNNKFVNGIGTDDYRSLADDRRKPLFNRPISGEYPPGSTFKIVTATASLGEGTLTTDKYLSSPGTLDIQGYKFPDWDPNGHGTINVSGALAQSSDVFFYKAAGGYNNEIKGVGPDKLGDYMRQFAIGKPSGIDLPDEKTGLVPTTRWKEDTFNEPWYIGDTYHMGIGQGFVLTTPLQVADYTAAIAGGGVAYKPHLVKAIEDPDNPANNKPVGSQPLVNLKVPADQIQAVREGMREAVRSGTSTELRDLPIEVCGKTGSAEFANETASHAWFTAFAPCNDPQIVVTVMIEGGGEGADVALPAAKSILESYFHIDPSKLSAKPAVPTTEHPDPNAAPQQRRP